GGPAAVEEHWVDETNASERLGVPPTRVTDYLALVGDTSDNVPGVKGVGEKTALELLRTFGDLDAILANPERIAGKRAREAVARDVELARLSRDLVTIRRDVPITLDLEGLRVRPPDVARLSELFTELEFRSLIPKLGSLEAVGTRSPAPADRQAPAVAGAPARGLRLAARELRARPRSPLARDQRPGARAVVARDADLCGRRGARAGRAPVRGGPGGGRGPVLLRRQ